MSDDTNLTPMPSLVAAVSAVAIAGGGVHVTVSTPSAVRDGMVRVTVTGLAAPAASVRIEGGLASGGRWFGWVPLLPSGRNGWWTVLRAPGFRGVYPLEVRAAGRVIPSDTTVRIVPGDFVTRRSFASPELVAEWWAEHAPHGAKVESVATWQSGFFTHRDPALNRLLAVRVRTFGRWSAEHLKAGVSTVYLSVARLTASGGWRLLERVSAP